MEFRKLVVPIEDVIQEGFIGLLRAIDSFDPTRHVRLVAYAGPMIRYAIMDMLKGHMRFIRPPKHIWDIRIKVARLRGRLGLWDEDFEAIAVNRLGVSPRKARKALGCVLTEVQLSTVDPDECESSLARSGAAEAAAERNEASADASASLASLPARQRDALEARFGLGGAAEMSFTEASRSRGVSSECIRKRAESGIEMLRVAMRGHA
jgi:RNA polymerase sigma factor (sigma-70 family)